MFKRTVLTHIQQYTYFRMISSVFAADLRSALEESVTVDRSSAVQLFTSPCLDIWYPLRQCERVKPRLSCQYSYQVPGSHVTCTGMASLHHSTLGSDYSYTCGSIQEKKGYVYSAKSAILVCFMHRFFVVAPAGASRGCLLKVGYSDRCWMHTHANTRLARLFRSNDWYFFHTDKS